ncbi:hypothetical protein J6590_048761 [Homalodisca vitripennis]|nr:hypothetical protein J6590_048761 [Homalodisca vitripennis]
MAAESCVRKFWHGVVSDEIIPYKPVYHELRYGKVSSSAIRVDGVDHVISYDKGKPTPVGSRARGFECD